MKTGKYTLKTYMPKSGMVYGDLAAITGKNDKDKDILQFFKARGSIRSGETDPRIRAVGRRRLQEALVAMFTAAAEPAVGAVMAVENDGQRFLHQVQERTEWAKDRRMNPRLFADLFNSLVTARQRWTDKPRAPYKIEEHCDLARAIDRYHAEQADWGRQLVRLHQEELVAREMVEDEDEDEDGEEDGEEDDGDEMIID